MNSQGQQKGVDSLIVTDLIDLARNQAMSDAVILSGDEDIRIGVQVAQAFGIRAHLLGISPSRGSQSRLLIQEADSTTEWDKTTVEKFLSLRPASPTATPFPTTTTTSASSSTPKNPVLDEVLSGLVASLNDADIAGIKAYSATQRGVPSEFDGRLLARSRSEIGRDLTAEEKRYIRTSFTAAIRARS